MRAFLLSLLLMGAALAGCAVPEPLAPAATPDDRAPSPGEDTGAPRGGSNDGAAAAAGAGAWPSLDDATIRPGVQVESPTGQCTSNFLFTSPDNITLYLGLAAHCVDGMEIGDTLDINHGEATGTLAYSSWLAMDEADEEDADALANNDFALVEIPADARGKAHPAMMHFGGPTALAASDAIAVGDKVLTYGNSGLRAEIDPASWHEGVVLEKTSAWSTTVYTATPGVPGDSGSGVLDAQGRALGVLVTLTLLPTTGSNGVTSLDLALAYAAAHGVDARLATWDVLDAGLLPAS